MGDGAVGSSLSLICPAEDKSHAKILDALNVQFQDVNIDGRLLNEAQERVVLATKIVAVDQSESRSHKHNSWFKEKALEVGMELDDDVFDEGLAGGDRRDQSRLREASKAKERLKVLLLQPMRTQRHGKFLSSLTAVGQREVAPLAVPQGPASKSKKRSRR